VDYTPSFVDGIGSASLLPEMWDLVRQSIHGAAVVTLEETAAAIRVLVERVRVVAEGAGAVPVAAALGGEVAGGTICCVVSGGNINPERLARILTNAEGALR
jgi:threonine dehydratase